MKRKSALLWCLHLSFFILWACAHLRAEADSLSDCLPSPQNSAADLWYTDIFESRTFSNLVVSINAEEHELFSEENGLFTASAHLQGRESEHPIRLFVYDREGNPCIAQNAGIRISGASSRNAARKSFRIIARKSYDKNHPSFTFDLWGGRKTLDGSGQLITEYSSFILHSVRQAMDATGIHNSVGYSLAQKSGIIDASPTVPAAFYLNGVYQGAYFILPAKNDHALAELYHIDSPGSIEVVSVFEEEKTGYQKNSEILQDYLEFVRFVQTSDLTDPEVLKKIEEQLDVEQCLQYYAVNLLLANGDWMDNNLRVWRCQNNGLPYQDGKWRFFLFDLDWIGSFPELTAINFQQATQVSENHNLLPFLLKNPAYLERFREIIAQMKLDAFNDNTIEAVFFEEEARMLPEILYDFQSDAFSSYLQHSSGSRMPDPSEYPTLKDLDFMIEDFKNHMLQAPSIVTEQFQIFYPEFSNCS